MNYSEPSRSPPPSPPPVPSRPVSLAPGEGAPAQYRTGLPLVYPAAWAEDRVEPHPVRPRPPTSQFQPAATASSGLPVARALPPEAQAAAVHLAPVRLVARPARPIPVPQDDLTIDTEDEADEADVPQQAVKAAPPWLVSLVAHMLLLLFLALWYMPQMIVGPVDLTVIYSEDLGEQLVDDSFQMVELEAPEVEPVLSDEFLPTEEPFAAPPDIPDVTFDAMFSSSGIDAPSIGLALSGRTQGMKEALLVIYGGTEKTEAAVELGLQWLKRNQGRDGLWSLRGPYSNGAGMENKPAATAMALLAFQGAGHTHLSGEHREVVDRAWRAMLERQDADGNFVGSGDGGHNHRLYTQALCTIAVCELYGMTKDSQFREPAQKAIDYAVRIQAPEGGWRYQPGTDSDLSVTGWFVMALQSAVMAGLEVPSPTLHKVSEYLDTLTPDDGISYSYRPGQGTTSAMSAEGLLCRQYLGWNRDDPRLVEGVNRLLLDPIDYRTPNVYYWYYATQVIHHMQGDAWNEWNGIMREVVPAKQIKTGRERGSWDPSGDRWGTAGRLYTTCLSIYLLEIYYRHLPIYSYRLQ